MERFRVNVLKLTVMLLMATSAIAKEMPVRPPVPPPTAGMGLEDCFQAALKRSEVIGEQVELIHQAEERYRAAVGAIMPIDN